MSEEQAHQGLTRWRCRRCNEERLCFTTILQGDDKRVIVRTCLTCHAEYYELQERAEPPAGGGGRRE